MSIEAGARAGMIASDDTTLDYIRGRLTRRRCAVDAVRADWRALVSDPEAGSTARLRWTPRTSPRSSPGAPVRPGAGGDRNRARRAANPTRRAGPRLRMRWPIWVLHRACPDRLAVDRVFIGSCTNARTKTCAAAAVLKAGARVPIMVVRAPPPSRQAESEGLDRLFRDAGCSWLNRPVRCARARTATSRPLGASPRPPTAISRAARARACAPIDEPGHGRGRGRDRADRRRARPGPGTADAALHRLTAVAAPRAANVDPTSCCPGGSCASPATTDTTGTCSTTSAPARRRPDPISS